MMQARRSLQVGALLLALCLFLVIGLTAASSSRPLPLKRIDYVSDIAIDLVPRDRQSTLHSEDLAWKKRRHEPIHHTDRLRLSFRAFDQNFHLHLEPNEELVPEEGATVRYVAHDPQTGQDFVTRTEVVQRGDMRAFHGVVVHSDYTHQRLLEDKIGLRRDVAQYTDSDIGVMGPASIVLHDDGSESSLPFFEGSFTWAGNEHTIQLPLNYQTSRTEHDPALEKRAIEAGSPLIHRMSDRMQEEEALLLHVRDRGSEPDRLGCNADDYFFNQETMRGIPSPFTFFASPQGRRHGRRDNGGALSHWLSGGSSHDLLSRSLSPSVAMAPASSVNTFDVRAPAYSYEAALTKRQDDALGGDNNDSFVSHIGSTQGCPNAPRVVYMGIASDCTYTARFSNDTDARIQILTLMNTVSNIYRTTFKVALGVVDIEVRDGNNCPSTSTGSERWNRACDNDYTLDQRLSDFSAWRANTPANGTGLWHLLTACSQGSEVGVAWLGTLCKTDSSQSGGSTVTGAGVSAVTQREAQVMAHEIGHNFGAIHDCVSGCSISGQTARQSNGAVCCPRTSSSCDTNGAYIMSPVSQTDTQTFSPCSVGNICSLLGQGLDTRCVNDPSQNPRETLSVQQCGNGILEPGEECDAGPDGSNCCTTSCKLRSGAVCDSASSACCTDSCQYASASTVCRPAVDDRCDTPEMCTGNSSTCPADIKKKDGTSCASGGLTCASGHCTSRDLQCQQQSQADYSFEKACSPNADQSCSVSCQNPDNSQSCLILQQQFIDGTSCGYGGRCEGGECKKGSWQDVFQGWYRNNLQVSIPVTIIVAFAVLALLYGLLRCLCLPLFGRARGRSVRGARGPVVAKSQRNSQGRGMFNFGQQTSSVQPPPQRYSPPSRSDYDSYNSPSSDPSPTPLIHDVGGRNNRTARSSPWVDPMAYNGPRGGNANV